MKKGLSALLLASLLCASSGCQQNPKEVVNEYNIVPMPNQMTPQEGRFQLSNKVSIATAGCTPEVQAIADSLIARIRLTSGISLQSNPQENLEQPDIRFVTENGMPKEGYKLSITPNEITLSASHPNGFFYGVQTMYQLLPPAVYGKTTVKRANWSLPAVEIEDSPRFPYRGLMLDVCRHFSTTDYIYKFIDMLAMHNINYFHWHLTEDQGWRIEIKKYPKLTEVGSKRDSTIIDWETKKFDGKPHSGFYTQDEAREIVRYAADRFITVVPEIDLPGHTTAALASYPELGCTGGPYKVLCSFGVFPDVLCAGNDQTLQFTKDVLDEIMDIFPSEYIHIGGDECPKSRWEKCPKCQAKIKELGIKALPKHSKENQLQTYFMSELEKEINAHGRRMLGWDEVLEGGLTPNSTIMSWRGIQGGIEAARQHHDVIMTPIQRLYFSNPRINKMTGFEWMNRVYNFEPVPAELTDAEKKFVIGTQGCIWTEWTADSTKMEWQILPRMAALSEIQWTLPEHKNFERFMERLPEMLKIYSSLDYGYREDVFAADTLKTHK